MYPTSLPPTPKRLSIADTQRFQDELHRLAAPGTGLNYADRLRGLRTLLEESLRKFIGHEGEKYILNQYPNKSGNGAQTANLDNILKGLTDLAPALKKLVKGAFSIKHKGNITAHNLYTTLTARDVEDSLITMGQILLKIGSDETPALRYVPGKGFFKENFQLALALQQAEDEATEAELVTKGKGAVVSYVDFLRGSIAAIDHKERQLVVQLWDELNDKWEYDVVVAPAYWEKNAWLEPGMQIGLADVDVYENQLTARYLTYMPFYLVSATDLGKITDGSMPAQEQLGHFTFLNKPFDPNIPAIVGNIVNSLFDKAINPTTSGDPLKEFLSAVVPQDFGLSILAVAKENWQNHLQSMSTELEAQHHNINRAIAAKFTSNIASLYAQQRDAPIDLKRVVLEANYLSPMLGLEGRADIIHDRSGIGTASSVDTKPNKFDVVEVKSGKPGFRNTIKPDHMTQVLVYEMLLRASHGFRTTEGNIKVMYSKQPNGVMQVEWPQDYEISLLTARNNLVNLFVKLASANGPDEVKEMFLPEGLNLIPPPDGRGYTTLEQVISLQDSMRYLPELPLHYLLEHIRFVYAEKVSTKLGNLQDPERSNGTSLWTKGEVEKLQNCELLHHLTISMASHAYPFKRLVLLRDRRAEDEARKRHGIDQSLAPSFREGDRVIIYPQPQGARANDPLNAVRNQVLKGSIARVSDQEVEVGLTDPILNGVFIEKHTLWAMEKDLVDSKTQNWLSAVFRAAASWNDEWVQKVMGLKAPQAYQSSVWPSDGLGGDALMPMQKRILSAAVASPDYYLIQGPPGTGKTRFVIKNLAWYYGIYLPGLKSSDLHPGIEIKPAERKKLNVLFIAFTNRAVDEICEQLHAVRELSKADGNMPVNFIRLGHSIGTDDAYAPFLLKNQVAELVKSAPSNKARWESLHKLVEDTNLVASTGSSAISQTEVERLKGGKWDVVIVDEASQMLEPFLMHFLLNAKKFILIGDHKQLPAVVVQQSHSSAVKSEILVRDLGLKDMRNSYFERLWYRQDVLGSAGYGRALLTHQGRMHKDIGQVVSQLFYNNQLELAIPERQEMPLEATWANSHFFQLPKKLLKLLNEKRLIFIQVDSDGHHAAAKSKATEAVLAAYLASAHLTERVNKPGCNFTEEVGIIAPFRNQVALISSIVNSYLGRNPALATNGQAISNAITVDTVERYQGSQRNLVVLSTTVVASHQQAALCSMDQAGEVDRKLNVAVSRAREQMVILGDAVLLEKFPPYKKLINIIRLSGGFVELGVSELAWLHKELAALNGELHFSDANEFAAAVPIA